MLFTEIVGFRSENNTKPKIQNYWMLKAGDTYSDQ
jgi:hypothetical protein